MIKRFLKQFSQLLILSLFPLFTWAQADDSTRDEDRHRSYRGFIIGTICIYFILKRFSF